MGCRIPQISNSSPAVRVGREESLLKYTIMPPQAGIRLSFRSSPVMEAVVLKLFDLSAGVSSSFMITASFSLYILPSQRECKRISCRQTDKLPNTAKRKNTDRLLINLSLYRLKKGSGKKRKKRMMPVLIIAKP